MSNTIWVQVRGEAEGSSEQRDNSFLLKFEKELDSIAERLGVTKVSAFHDYSALAEEFGEELGDLPEGTELPAEAWSDAKEGHRTVSALIQELRAHPEALRFQASSSRSHWPAALLDDLGHCQAVLAQAAAQGRTFRFLVVP